MSPLRDGGLSDVLVRHPANAIKHPTPTDSDQGDEWDGLLLELDFERPAERVEVGWIGNDTVDAAQGCFKEHCGPTGREGGGVVVRHEMMPRTESPQPVPDGIGERTTGRAKRPAGTTEHASALIASHVWVMRRACGALAVVAWWAVLVARLLWWLPTIAFTVVDLAWREIRFRHCLARVRRLRRAGRLDDAQAALDGYVRISRCEVPAYRYRTMGWRAATRGLSPRFGRRATVRPLAMHPPINAPP